MISHDFVLNSRTCNFICDTIPNEYLTNFNLKSSNNCVHYLSEAKTWLTPCKYYPQTLKMSWRLIQQLPYKLYTYYHLNEEKSSCSTYCLHFKINFCLELTTRDPTTVNIAISTDLYINVSNTCQSGVAIPRRVHSTMQTRKLMAK